MVARHAVRARHAGFQRNRNMPEKRDNKGPSLSPPPLSGPKPLRTLEHSSSKAALFQCRGCGDSPLPDIAFLVSRVAMRKKPAQRPINGGKKEGHCEVDNYGDCIWLRAYERLKHDGKEQDLLKHAPVVQNQGLRGTSAWANNWAGPRPRSEESSKCFCGRGDFCYKKRTLTSGPKSADF